MKKKEPHTCKHCGVKEEYLPDVYERGGRILQLFGKLCDHCHTLFDAGKDDGERIGARAERERWRTAVSLAEADYPAHAFPEGAGAVVRQVLARVIMMATGEGASDDD